MKNNNNILKRKKENHEFLDFLNSEVRFKLMTAINDVRSYLLRKHHEISIRENKI